MCVKSVELVVLAILGQMQIECQMCVFLYIYTVTDQVV